MSKLPDKTALPDDQATDDLEFHVVDPSDPADDPAGSSFRGALNQFAWGAKFQGYADVTLAGTLYSGTMQSNQIAAYVEGGVYLIRPDAESINSCNVNLNSIANASLWKGGNNATTSRIRCTLGDLLPNQWYVAVATFLNAAWQFNIMNPEYPNMIVAEYDFATDGGAVGVMNLTTTIIPQYTFLDVENVIVHMETALTSGGLNPLIALGVGVGAPQDALVSHVPLTFDGNSQRTFRGRNIKVGSVQLSAGAAGSVNSVTINGTDILNSASVAFNVSRAQTASDVADDINDNPLSNIRAIAQDEYIYLYQPDYGKFLRNASNNVGVNTTTLTAVPSALGNVGGQNSTNVYQVAGALVPVSFLIANDALTGGKFRIYIPIIKNQKV